MWIHKQQLSTTTGVCRCWGGSEDAQVERQGRCPPSPGLQASGRQALISSRHPGYMLRRMGLQREKKGPCFSQVGGEGLADTHPRPERWSKPGNKKSWGGPAERQPGWAGLQVVREEQTLSAQAWRMLNVCCAKCLSIPLSSYMDGDLAGGVFPVWQIKTSRI